MSNTEIFWVAFLIVLVVAGVGIIPILLLILWQYIQLWRGK